MKQDDRLHRFKLEADAGQRAFSAMGKLFRVIEANLKKTQGIYPVLAKLGIKKGTISNASYAAKVFDLVDAGALTEAEFDTLSFNDCFQIARVKSAGSAKRIGAEEIAVIIRAGGDFAEEFQSLYENGVTAAEKAAADKSAAEAKAKAEADAKAKAEQDAADLAAAQKENEELKAQLAAEQANQEPAPEPQPGEQEPGDPENPENPENEGTEDGEQGESGSEDEAPAPESTTPPEQTAPPRAITAADVLPLLDEVEIAFTELSAEDQAIVAARLIEMADRVCTAGIAPDPSGAKEPGKPSASAVNPDAAKPKKGKGKKAKATA
jgi:hypothetical protein